MKKLVILMVALVFAACSSKPKADETATTSDVEKKVMEATDTTSTTTTETAPEEKKSKKKAKEAAVQETTTETTSSSGSDFPAITGTEKSSVTCSTKGDTRKISVLNVTEGGCGVVYNKQGADKTMALAKSDMNYCDNVSSKIKSNLEAAGFDCGGGTASESTGTSSDAPASTNQ